MRHDAAVDLGIEGITEATRVAHGGYGTVYRARQEALGRTVAVKVLAHAGVDGDALRRFDHECRAVGALSGHPHVVGVYDSGHTADGRPYIVLDYLPGGTLAERVAERGPLPWQEVADVGVKLAGALASAHAAGVLHRDVKPENVLLSSYGEPHLADFGVARIQGGTETQSGVVTASIAHAAPEVLSGDPATEGSDVYSLASTLYAAAAGHAPFIRPGDQTFHPMLARLMREAPPDLRPLGVPAMVWEAVSAALAKDPAVRTSSARALGEALRAAQLAAGVAPTPLVAPERPAPDVGATGPPAPDRLAAAAPVAARPPESVTHHWGRPWPSEPSPAAPPAGIGDRSRPARPPWAIAALVVALVALAGAVVFALTRGGDAGAPTTLDAAPTTVPPVTVTVAPEAPDPLPAGQPAPTAPASLVPTTAAPLPAPAPAAVPGPSADGAVPACTPSFFRPTVTTDRPTYRNGETVRVTARFENVSGQACSYAGTTFSSQVLDPSGAAVTPVRTLPQDNAGGFPFQPGTSQSFVSSWEVAACAAQACPPGRYTAVADVAPFGGGRVSFEVA